MKKVRLDQLVFDQGLSESRERAKAIIMSGVVYVNGQRADKPGAQVAPDAKIEVRGNTLPYVSRGGFKLEKALKVFPIDPTGLTCIDCGASTGGFTDVLLQNGAAKVYAVVTAASAVSPSTPTMNVSAMDMENVTKFCKIIGSMSKTASRMKVFSSRMRRMGLPPLRSLFIIP